MRILRYSNFVFRIDNYYRRNQDKFNQNRYYCQLIYFDQYQEYLKLFRICELL